VSFLALHVARLLADEHDARVGRTFAEDRLRAGLPQGTGAAGGRFASKLGEGGGLAHEPEDRAQGERTGEEWRGISFPGRRRRPRWSRWPRCCPAWRSARRG